MEAPATRESKPRSTARDAGHGQARNARRVTGPLAGAVLGPTVCGGCERGRWHRTIPTTGLFQRDGGRFGLGGGVFVTEEGLTEGVDAGVDGVDPGAQRVDPAVQSTFHGVDASGQEGEQGDAGPLGSAETSASCKTTTAGDAGACVGPHAGVFGSRETNKRTRFPGYSSMPAPKKRRHTESYGFVFRPNGPKFALEPIFGYLGYAGSLEAPALPAKLKELRVI